MLTHMAAVTAALVTAVVLVPVPAYAAPRCFGERATIVGGANDDVYGTKGRDVIVAGTGESRAYGRGGNDLICLGANGYKWAFGGPGHDRIHAGRGYDFKTLKGGPGNDLLYDPPGGGDPAFFDGGGGDDEILAGSAPDEPHMETDVLDGGRGDDILLQGAGRSLIRGGPGDDAMSGGLGVDTVSFGDSPTGVTVDVDRETARGHGRDSVRLFEHVAGSGLDDRLIGSKHADTLEGLDGNDVLVGGDGDDTFVAGGGDDEALGQGGSDSLAGGDGDDRLDGGGGEDVADYYYHSDSAVSVDLAAGTATGEGTDALVSLEHAAAAGEGSVLLGDDGDNTFVVGSRIQMDGRAGSDTIEYLTGTDEITVDLALDTDSRANVLTDIENVTRRAGSALIAYGDDGPNTIVGAQVGDQLDGRGGDDVLRGRFGDDVLDGGEGHDVLDGGKHATRRGDECVNGEDVRNCER